MVAPAASTEEAVVEAENIVSLSGLSERTFAAIRMTIPIAATASAIRGAERKILPRFMMIPIMAAGLQPSAKQGIRTSIVPASRLTHNVAADFGIIADATDIGLHSLDPVIRPAMGSNCCIASSRS